MIADQPGRRFALIKVADEVVAGERFCIIRPGVDRGAPSRRSEPLDTATAERELRTLGCDSWTIALMLRDARDAFDGLQGLHADADAASQDDDLPH